MRTFKNIILLMSVVWLGSCASSSVAVRSDYDRQVNFREYNTYSIAELKEDKNDPILGSSLNQKRFAQAMDAEMKARGYVKTNESPDLVVSFQTDSRNKQFTQNNNMGPWWWYGNNNTSTRSYEEDRVIVNLFDAKTKELVWQGWATGELNNRKKERDVTFKEAIYRIMQEYPHRASGYANNATTDTDRK
jgi:hypothetical protein